MPTVTLDASDHKLQSLTVFRTGNAEIVRSFELSLKKGDHEIELVGLANCIEPDSARISGLGADARLVDLVHTLRSQRGPFEESDALRELNIKKQTLEDMKLIRQQEVEMYCLYGQSISSKSVPPADLVPFLQTFVDVRKGILSAVNALDAQLREVDKAIADEKAKQVVSEQATGRIKLSVLAEKDCDVKLKLAYIVSNASWEPIYDLHATTTKDGKPSSQVLLHYCARVKQSTGENWKNATLTLSTAVQSKKAIDIPRLPTYQLRQKPPGGGLFIQQRQQQQQQQQQQAHPAPTPFGSFGSAPAQGFVQTIGGGQQGTATPLVGRSAVPQTSNTGTTSGGLFGGGLFGAASQQAAGTTSGALFGSSATTVPAFGMAASSTLREEEEEESVSNDASIIQSTPLSVSYTVEGAFNVPSDDTSHTVSIAALTLKAEVTRVCVPRISDAVILQCKVQNTSEYHILPGPGSIFLNDSLVARTQLGNILPKDHFECALGADPSMRVKHERTRVAAPAPAQATFGAHLYTVIYTAETTITNKSSFAISDVIVRDALPLAPRSLGGTVNVTLKAPEGLADAKDGQEVNVREAVKARWSKKRDGKGGEAEGKYEWMVDIGAGRQVTLKAQWEVKSAQGLLWEEVADGF